MAKKEIPAQTVWTCDCCANELIGKNWRYRGKVETANDVHDLYGHAVAGENHRYDLCDTCFTAVNKAIVETIKGKETPCSI
ncbi:MAG: hypothetical protein ITG01_11995 [Comamonas sp.]|nr:hypothetical protein [Comamonas sp.]